MHNTENQKTIPRSILIFGAAAHVGRPLARFLRSQGQPIRLRLASSQPERQAELRREFPDAEVVGANYFDLPSLEAAVEGMEGIFVITPSGTDERPAMRNLVAAVKKAGCAVHILRCVGMQPEANLRRIPTSLLKAPALGLPVQHPLVKQILDESELPVTYLNFGATFMDNLFWMRDGLKRERKLIWLSTRPMPTWATAAPTCGTSSSMKGPTRWSGRATILSNARSDASRSPCANG